MSKIKKISVLSALTGLLLSSSALAGSHSSNQLTDYTVENFDAGDARVKISLDTNNPHLLNQNSIRGLAFCERPNRCINVERDALDLEVSGPNSSTLATIGIPSDYSPRFIRVTTKNNRRKNKSQLIRLRDNFDLAENGNYELYLSVVNRGRGRNSNLRASYGAFAQLPPTTQTSALIVNRRKTELKFEEIGVELSVPRRAVNKDGILFAEGQRNLTTGEGMLHVTLPPNLYKPVTAMLSFDDPNLLPGTAGSYLNIKFNGEDVSLTYEGLNEDATQIYSFSLEESGLLQLVKKDFIELAEAGLPLPPAPNRGNSVNAPQPGNSSQNFQDLAPSPSQKSFGVFAAQAAQNVVFTNSCAIAVDNIQKNDPTDMLDYADLYGVAEFNTCVTTPPGVHIVIQNSTQSQSRAYYNFGQVNSSGFFELRNAFNHMQDNPVSANIWRVAINGFTWEGDLGLWPDLLARGFPNSSQRSYNNQVTLQSTRDWRIGFTDHNSFGANIPDFSTKPDGAFEPTSPYNYHIVASETPILENGVCDADPTNSVSDRWSTMGIVDRNGQRYTVLMSTATGVFTTPLEICQVYQALGAQNAIRLDGGSAAQLWVGGVHRNSLIGIDFAAFGSARQTISGLGLK